MSFIGASRTTHEQLHGLLGQLINSNSCRRALAGSLMVGNRDSTRDLASDQSIVSDWHDLQAARRSEEWSATYRKKVAIETVFDRHALQFERACNRLSVVWLYRGLNASRKRNVVRTIGSAGAGKGALRLHRIGGWLKGTTRSRLLKKSMRVTARNVGHCAGGTLSRSVSLPGFTSTEQTSCRME